ncbi:MAG: dienelactone hydrolase family protein [Myxococcaceae bacterium]
MNRLALAVSLLSAVALAAPTRKNIAYDVNGVAMEGVLITDGAKAKPGLVLVPNWLGINEANLKQAELVASHGYTVFVADMYGKEARPKTMQDAGKAAGAVKGDRPLMRARANKALEMLIASGGPALDKNKLAAIGFCFGGTSALELARSGAKIAATVSFHGGLSSPTPDDAKNIKGKVLAMNGADDPNVPRPEVAAFEEEMRKAKVDWQLVDFGNTVHSFTDVDANTPGQAQYNPVAAKRAYQMMDEFLTEAFANAK